MFMKTIKKKIKSAAVEPKPASAEVQPQSAPSSVGSDLPHPDMLLELAMEEDDRRILGEYIQTIQLLRNEKRFTFREIAEWLNENGVETDHNAVYRAYIRHLPEEVAEQVAQEAEHEDQEQI